MELIMEECGIVEAGFIEITEVLRQGVYLLVHRDAIVYVGKAKVMLGRLYTHRVKWGSRSRKAVTATQSAKGILFDRVFVRPCRSDEIDDLEAALIAQHRPRYNLQLKSAIPSDMEGIVARIIASRGGSALTQPRINRRGF